MHPAPSIIAFTTLSGFGYGLAFLLGLGLLDPTAMATKVAHVLALALIAGGLTASTLHLGNPRRAWRALSQWRTSWLSREGVLAIATFVPLVVAAYACVFHGRYVPAAGVLGSLGAAATVYSTSMIYASLRAVQAWNTRLTSACYLAFALAGGALLAVFFAVLGGSGAHVLVLVALIATGWAWRTKLDWWRRLAKVTPLSTAESATRLGSIGRVRPFEPPHTNPNYLTREMGFRIGRKHADKLQRIALVLGAMVPALMILAMLLIGVEVRAVAAALALGAVLSFGAAMAVERWLFFAQARHAVMVWYDGAPSA